MIRKISKRLCEANDKVAALVAEGKDLKSGEVAQAPVRAAPTSAVSPVMPRAQLVAQSTSVVYSILKPLTLIGRHDPVTGIHPEIDLSKEQLGKSVSRRHAKIEFRDGQFFLTEEIGTLNNTTVNGVKLETGVMTPLIDGDEICLGAVKLLFRQLARPA
jgi:pSer/pThr/pTyr-binding forkhead associated (FHA) protein